jgi:hypothetical protein
MKTYKTLLGIAAGLSLLAFCARIVHSKENATDRTVQVHMVITDQALSDNSEVPPLRSDSITVKQGKDSLKSLR